MFLQIAPGEYKMMHYAIATSMKGIRFMWPLMISGYISEWLGYENILFRSCLQHLHLSTSQGGFRLQKSIQGMNPLDTKSSRDIICFEIGSNMKRLLNCVEGKNSLFEMYGTKRDDLMIRFSGGE